MLLSSQSTTMVMEISSIPRTLRTSWLERKHFDSGAWGGANHVPLCKHRLLGMNFLRVMTDFSSLRSHHFTMTLDKDQLGGNEVIVSELTYYEIIVAFTDLLQWSSPGKDSRSIPSSKAAAWLLRLGQAPSLKFAPRTSPARLTYICVPSPILLPGLVLLRLGDFMPTPAVHNYNSTKTNTLTFKKA
jgi:hypothetical protein